MIVSEIKLNKAKSTKSIMFSIQNIQTSVYGRCRFHNDIQGDSKNYLCRLSSTIQKHLINRNGTIATCIYLIHTHLKTDVIINYFIQSYKYLINNIILFNMLYVFCNRFWKLNQYLL